MEGDVVSSTSPQPASGGTPVPTLKEGATRRSKSQTPQTKSRGTTRAGKKTPIFWDSDGVNNGKSSLRVVLGWMSSQINYDKWRCSDRNNENTKEALLKEIVRQLVSVGIQHRDSAGVREKINSLEKQYREAEDFLASTGAGITDESNLRAAILKRCPHYFELQDVMTDRPSARPKVTSDDIDDEEDGTAAPSTRILQNGKKRPLAANSSQNDKKQKPDSVERLLNQQAEIMRAREEKRANFLEYQERGYALKEKEVRLKEEKNSREKAQADVDLALKKVQPIFSYRIVQRSSQITRALMA